MHTTAPSGTALSAVLDVGHSASTLSGVVVPVSAGWYLSVGTVVVPVGAVGGPGANPSTMLIDVAPIETMNELTVSANLLELASTIVNSRPGTGLMASSMTSSGSALLWAAEKCSGMHDFLAVFVVSEVET